MLQILSSFTFRETCRHNHRYPLFGTFTMAWIWGWYLVLFCLTYKPFFVGKLRRTWCTYRTCGSVNCFYFNSSLPLWPFTVETVDINAILSKLNSNKLTDSRHVISCILLLSRIRFVVWKPLLLLDFDGYLRRAHARRIHLFLYYPNTCACGTFRSISLFTLFLEEEFDYTARVQHVLHTTGCSWVEEVLDNM